MKISSIFSVTVFLPDRNQGFAFWQYYPFRIWAEPLSSNLPIARIIVILITSYLQAEGNLNFFLFVD